MKSPTVIVVGAGVAGLSCARELTRRGIETMVLEREAALGGRCATRMMCGQPVDGSSDFRVAGNAGLRA